MIILVCANQAMEIDRVFKLIFNKELVIQDNDNKDKNRI